MFFGNKKPVSVDEEKIQTLLSRSVSEVIPSPDSLRKLLTSGKRLRIKLGIDPTSPHLHIGRAVTLLKLRDFQDLGHTVVFIIGDATGVVGDTSDKNSERPMLSRSTIEKNLSDYVTQVEKILDRRQMEVRHNSEWLLKLNYAEIGEQADQFSVADFIARELIKKRIESGSRVSLRELLYPLMQGYDSVAINADVEIGGTDQRFNLLAGRTLQSHYGQTPQHVFITGPLIPGTDGRKMSSSWGNTINLSDEPNDMFGKIMGIPDTLVETYLIHATRLADARIQEIRSLHPRDAKMALAHEIVRIYHSASLAQKAQEHFVHTFSKGGAPDDSEVISLKGRSIKEALVASGVVESNTEFRRLEEAGAIRFVDGGEKITEDTHDVVGKDVRIGKRRFVRFEK